MNSPLHRDPPSEPEIESLLTQFRPKPSQNFYQRMRTAPWKKPGAIRSISNLAVRKLHYPLLWGSVAIITLLLVATIAFIPPVRAIARQILYSFFAEPSTQINVQVTLSSPGDLFNYSDPSNFPLRIEQAQAQAGFLLRQISPLPEGLVLVGARYDPSYNAVVSLYQGNNYALFLTQRPLGNSQDVFSVGNSATVEMVKIGNIQGEFVRGGWKAVSTQPVAEAQTTPASVNITAIWDEHLPQSTLRWQAAKMAYELRAVGEGSPSQSDLIMWANELK